MNDELKNPVQSQIDAMTGSTPASIVSQPNESQIPVQPEQDNREELPVGGELQEPQEPQETYVKDGKTVRMSDLDPNEPIIPYTGGVASPGVVYSNAEVDPQTAMTGKQYLRFKKVKPYKLQMPDGKMTVTDTIDPEKARYQYLALSRDQIDPSDWYGYNPIEPWRPSHVGSFFRSAANTVTSIPFDLVSLGAIMVGAPETAKASQEAFTESVEMHPGAYYLNIPERKWSSMLGMGTAAALGFIGTGGAGLAVKGAGLAGRALALKKAGKAVEAATKATDTGAKVLSRAEAMKAFARAEKFDKVIAKANLMPLQLQKVGTGYNWYMSAGEGANSAVNIYEDALSKGVGLDSATFAALLGGGLVAAVGQAPEFITGVTGTLSNVSVRTAAAALRGDRETLKALFWKKRALPAGVLEAFSEVGQDVVESGFTGEELDAATEYGTAMIALVMAGGLSAIGKNKFVEGNIKYAENWKENTKLQIKALYDEALARGDKIPKGFLKLAYAMVDDPSLTSNIEELVQKGYLEQIDKMQDLSDDQKEQLREIFNNPDLNVSQEAWNALDNELDGILNDTDFTQVQKDVIKSIMHGFAVHGILNRTISSPAQLVESLKLGITSSNRSGTTPIGRVTSVEINTNAKNQLPQGMQGTVDTTGMEGNMLVSAQAKNNAQRKDATSMEQSGVVADAIHELIGHFLGGDRRKVNAFIQYFQKMTEALAEVYPEGNKEGKLSPEEAEEYRAYAMQMSNKYVAEVLGLEGQGAEMLNFFESAMLAKQANVRALQNYVKALKTLMEQNATMVQAMISNHKDAADLSASIKQFAKTGDAGSLTAEDLEALQRVFRSGLSDSNTKLDLATLIDDASTYTQLSDRLKGQYETAMAADRKAAQEARAQYLKSRAQTRTAQNAIDGIPSPIVSKAVLQTKDNLEKDIQASAKNEPEQVKTQTESTKGVTVDGTEYKLLTKQNFDKDSKDNFRISEKHGTTYMIDEAVHGDEFSKEKLDRYAKSVVDLFKSIPGGDQYMKFAQTLDYKKANVVYERIFDETGKKVIGYNAKYYGKIPGGEITASNAYRNTDNVPTAKLSSAIAYAITIQRMRNNDNKTKYAVQGAIDITDIVSDTLEGTLLLPAPEGWVSTVDIINDFKEKMYASASMLEYPGTQSEAYAVEKQALEELKDKLSNKDLDNPVVISRNNFVSDKDRTEYRIPQTVKYNGKNYKFFAEEIKPRDGSQDYSVRPAYNNNKFVYGFFGGKTLNVDKIVDNIAKKVAQKRTSADESYETYITDDLIRAEIMKAGVFDKPNMPGAVQDKYTAVTASTRKAAVGNNLARQVVAKVYSALESAGNIVRGSTTYDMTITLRDFIDGAISNIEQEYKYTEKSSHPREEAMNYELSKKDKNLVATAIPSVKERDKLLEKYISDVYKNKRIKNKEQVLQLLKDVYREDYASWKAYSDTVARSVENLEKWAKSMTAQIETQSIAMGLTPEEEANWKNTIVGSRVESAVAKLKPEARRVDLVNKKEAKLNAEKESIEAIRLDPLSQAIASKTLAVMGTLHGFYGQDKFSTWSPTSTAEREVENAKEVTGLPVGTEYQYKDEEGNEKTEQTAKDVQEIYIESMDPKRYGFQGDELDDALRITGTKRENFDNVEVPETAVTQIEFIDAYLQAAKAKIIARAKQIFPVTDRKNEGLNTQASLAEFRKVPENQLYEIGVLRDAWVAARKAFSDRFATTTDALMEQSRDNIVVEAKDAENAIGFVESLPVTEMLPISNHEKKMPMVKLPSDELRLIKAGNVVKLYYGGEWISGVVTLWNQENGSFILQGTNDAGKIVQRPIIADQLIEADEAYHNPVFIASIPPLNAKEIEKFNTVFEDRIGEPSMLTKTRDILDMQRRNIEEVDLFSANPEELAMTKFAVQGDINDLGLDDTEFLLSFEKTAREADFAEAHLSLKDISALGGNARSDFAIMNKFDTPNTSKELLVDLGKISKARETMDRGPKISVSMFANSHLDVAKALTGGVQLEEVREEGKWLPTLVAHDTLSAVLDSMTNAVKTRKLKSFLVGLVCNSGAGRSLDVVFGSDAGINTNVEAVAQKAQDIRERSTEHNMAVVREALNSDEAKKAGVKESYADWNIGRTMDLMEVETYDGVKHKITRGEAMSLYAAYLVETETVDGEFGKEFKYPVTVMNGGNAIFSRLQQTYKVTADQLKEAMPECDKIVARALLDASYAKNPNSFVFDVGNFDKMKEFGYALRSKNYKRLSAAESVNPSIHLGVIDMFNAMDKHNAAIAIRESGIADYYKMLNGLFEIGTYTSVDALAEKFDLAIETDEDRAAGEMLIQKSRALNNALAEKLSPAAYEAFRRQLADAVKTGSVLEDDLPVSSGFVKMWERFTRTGQANALFAKPKNAILNMLSSYMRTGALTTGTLKHNTVDLVNAIAHLPQALQYAKDFPFLQNRFIRQQLGTEFEKAVDTTSTDSLLAEIARKCANNKHMTRAQLAAELDKLAKKLAEYGVGYTTAGADYIGLVMSWYNVGPKLIEQFKQQGLTEEAAKVKAQELFQWQTLRTVSSSNYATRGPLQKWMARHHLEAVCAFLNDTIQSWASLAENVHQLYNTTDTKKREVIWRTINSNIAAQMFYISVQAAAWSALASMLFGDGLSDDEEEALQQSLVRETVGQLTGIFGAGSEYIVKPLTDSLVFGKGSQQSNIALASTQKALQDLHNGNFFEGLVNMGPAVGVAGMSRIWDLVDAMGYVFQGGEATKLGLEQIMGFSKSTAMKQLGQKETKSGKIVKK